uniref:non-specific serine/threonine protein kinase n=2 Tax=Fagus sylvatica TaxID=28930 RepID=A0A2N9FTH2_FAGSY
MDLAISFAFLLFFPYVAQSQDFEFIFNGFNNSENLTREGASIFKPSGALKLTNATANVTGQAFYTRPIQMFNNKSRSYPNASSFSTSFVFAIRPAATSSRGGYGLAFILSPSTKFPGAQPGHYLGIFSSSNDGNPSNHIFAVEFDTVKGHNETSDSEGNHVGININSMSSNASRPAGYYDKNDDANLEEIILESNKPIRAWIEYDGVERVVNVTISYSLEEIDKPKKPLISRHIDLTPILKETMYVGFSAATGKKTSFHYILAWSFAINGAAPLLNISQLPLPPPSEESSSAFKPQVKVVIAIISAFTLVLLGILFFFTCYKKMTRKESLEDWELDCPHRFKYKDLYAATKGFKESEVIGVGGFGAVYKGIVPATGNEVAVKKIIQNSSQGMREFAAEIESLGRLRHKNLVNLQGWCKHKNDLLIVYDYIPNGGLDSLIFKPRNNFVLTWDARYNILKGVALGLLYLHEEWEQVVIHRDVKSSNVLIDAELNARLGDFGLARLFDHDKLSYTTNVVGTIGYLAPELARTGKVSTSSDVFAYGILLLEVVTGRRPIDNNSFVLVDWLMECQQLGQILDAVDPKLNSTYVVEEVELVLDLGLLCSHHKPEARPTMRQVARILSRDDPIPAVPDWGSVDFRSVSEMNSRSLELISGDMTTRSYPSSSFGGITSSSIDSGR